MITNRRFDFYHSLFFVVFVAIFLGFVIYLAMVGDCMFMARQVFGIQYEDTFTICFRQIGAFR